MWWKCLVVIKAAALEFWIGLGVCVQIIPDPKVGMLVFSIGSTLGFCACLIGELFLNEGAKKVLGRSRWGRVRLQKMAQKKLVAEEKADRWGAFITQYGWLALLALAFLPIPLGAPFVVAIWIRHRSVKGGLCAIFIGNLLKSIFWLSLFYGGNHFLQALFS